MFNDYIYFYNEVEKHKKAKRGVLVVLHKKYKRSKRDGKSIMIDIRI